MSKSLKRVRAALDAACADAEIRETAIARTALDAAAALDCEVDQIAKSILFAGTQSGRAVLFLTAGGNSVAPDAAARLAGEPLTRADARFVRSATGFAIGGVAPLGLIRPCPVFFDLRLMDFPVVWAAAGTPHHVFGLTPQDLCRLSHARIGAFTA